MYIPPGHFAKDLTRITSDMGDVILIDNDQSSFMLQPGMPLPPLLIG